MSTELRGLIDRLNPLCRRALETAGALCVSQTHYNVEVEHLLRKLLDLPATDLEAVLRYYEVRASELIAELEAAMEKFKRGNSRTPSMSPQVVTLLKESWTVTTLQLQSPAVRSGALLSALFESDLLRGTVILESAPVLAKIPRQSLRENLRELIRGSAEETAKPSGKQAVAYGGEAGTGESSPVNSETPALDRYTIDLTREARAGKIDPIRGRAAEIRQVIDILTRRRQNNPILVGDAGVGKTAIVEGFALRVVAGNVPEPLKKIAVRILDLGLLQAGAGVKGEFEERLKTVITEVTSSARRVILFIDEAHTLIGAGGQAGGGDAANLLKPALARGELRTIAATTWSEYKKYIEKDPALTRRFQLVKIEEPDEDSAIDMLRGIAPNLEDHHRVRILDEAVRDAVRLSARYLSERRLPDKAISVLDTACARVALAQEGAPAAVEDVRRRIRLVQTDLAILNREGPGGLGRNKSPVDLAAELERLEVRSAELESRWREELEMVGDIQSLRSELESARCVEEPDSEAVHSLSARLDTALEACKAFQDGEAMVPVAVDSEVVASVISGWTGIPAGRMMTDEVSGVLSLEGRLGERIIGQPRALDAICRRIQTSRAGLEDPAKPKGVFLLIGPTGVGKTETAIALAEVLYGGEKNLVTVNMSEFQEPHSIATLKGSPPGYVGYGRGGVLTEAVRRRPYSVVLLDEVEKGHQDVMELFFQVFDKGVLEDGEGVLVDFKNTVILLTSNMGGELIERQVRESAEPVAPEELVEAVRPVMLRKFSPAFLGRLVVVPYYPLGENEIREIVKLKLRGVQERIRENHMAELTFDEGLVDSLASKCTETDTGAREIEHILTQTFLPELSGRILERMAAGEEFEKVHVSVDEFGGFV